MRGKRELKAMWTDPRMKELIESLWREYYGLYNEKYNRDPEKWLLNKIDKDIDYGQALGQDHLIEGNRSAAWGQGHVTKSFMEIVLGAYNLVPVGQDAEEWIPTDLLLTLGNGPDEDNRSNVFEIYKNGFVKFLQSIKIGKHHDLEELETPENGTLQWTPEDGLEIWVDDHWEPVGGLKHPPVTIHADSTAQLEIDGNQVLKFTGDVPTSEFLVHIKFEEVEAFTYTCPYALKFTAMIHQQTNAPALSVALDTNMAQYDDLVITPDETGLVTLTGEWL